VVALGRLHRWLEERISLLVLAAAIGFFTARLWVPAYYTGPIQIIAIYTIISVGLGLLLGFSGQFILSQGAVYAAGAYTSALLTTNEDWPVWASMIAAVLMGAAIGVLLGLPALRLRSYFLALATLGFAVITPQLLLQWKGLTGGFAGVSGIPRPSFFGHTLSADEYYYFVVIMCIAVLWLTTNLLRSRWRLAFIAVRDDEVAASACAVPVYRVKLVAFVFASSLAGLAGALYASYLGFISPETFSFELTLGFLVAVIVGGPMSVAGPLLGSVGTAIGPEVLNFVHQYQDVIYGGMLVLAPVQMPDGFVGFFNRTQKEPAIRAFRRWRQRRTPPTAAPPQPVPAIPPAPRWTEGPVLSLQRLTKSFGGVRAVDGVDLAVHPGTVYGLIGPNGSGKTTLVNVVSGIYAPDSGSVKLSGRSIGSRSSMTIARLGAGRTFQTPRTFPHLTVLENVMVSLFKTGRANMVEVLLNLPRCARERKEQRERAEHLLRVVGLYDQRDAPSTDLTLAQQRFLEIARALALGPRVLLLDEPAAGLSPAEIADFKSMIVALREAGYAILLVDHHAEMMFELADQVTVLNYGQVIASGEAAKVRHVPAVIEAYLGA
jgi:branched-chain amino acid transport system permease protein